MMRTRTLRSLVLLLVVVAAPLAPGCGGSPATPPAGTDAATPNLDIDDGESATKDEVMEGKQ